jgi:hypothetical protein
MKHLNAAGPSAAIPTVRLCSGRMPLPSMLGVLQCKI